MAFTYDIALSFLAADEPLALQLYELLSPRLNVFLYSKNQEEIAGKDGEQAFAEVFSSKARIVVILYRPAWGTSPFTRIEETAIRNRAYTDGYDFTIFIPLHSPATVPNWLPKNRLWIGLERWGVDGAAAVIEARVQEAGGAPNEETALQRAERLERTRLFQTRRNTFRRSLEGVDAAAQEFEVIHSHIVPLLDPLNRARPVPLILERQDLQLRLFSHARDSCGLKIVWTYSSRNSLENSTLSIFVCQGHPPFPGAFHFEEPPLLKSQEFDFDLSSAGAKVWRSRGARKEEFSSKMLADYALKLLFNVEEERLKRA